MYVCMDVYKGITCKYLNEHGTCKTNVVNKYRYRWRHNVKMDRVEQNTKL